MSRLRRGLMAGILLVLTACGSTLQPTELATGDSSGEMEVVSGSGMDAGPDDTAPSDSTADAAGASSAGSGSIATGSGGTATAAGQTPSPSDTEAPPSDTEAPGASSDTGPIRVGIASVDPAALATVFGVDTSDIDLWEADKALIAAINDGGGVAGRQIEPTFFLADIAADQNAEAQRACESFVTDNAVDVVIAYSANAVLVSCLGQHNIAVVDSNVWVPDTTYTGRFANWILPNTIAVDRYASAAIQVSLEIGTLKSGDTLGILYEDCDWGSRVVDSVLTPLANNAGVDVERATVKCIENLVGDLGPVTNQANSAAVRFKSDEVTHVLTLTAAEGFVVGRFALAAHQQGYHPHYILTTNAFPANNVNPDSAVAWDRASLGNMTGVGWSPHTDIGELAPPTGPQAAQRQACEAAYPQPFEAQYENESDRISGLAGAYDRCDFYFGVRDILAGAAGRFDAGSVVAAFRAWAPTSVPSTAFAGATRSPQGIGFVRPFSYDAGSGKFVYTGEPRPVP